MSTSLNTVHAYCLNNTLVHPYSVPLQSRYEKIKLSGPSQARKACFAVWLLCRIMTTKIIPPASFTILNKQMTQINTAERLTAKAFLVFSTKSQQIAMQQSHIINLLLTSFARSVRKSIALGFYRSDENLRQYFPVQTSHSVNNSLFLYVLVISSFQNTKWLKLDMRVAINSKL